MWTWIAIDSKLIVSHLIGRRSTEYATAFMEDLQSRLAACAQLTMRLHMRRNTRLTNAHGKKFENHCHMVARYTVWYNFVRINQALKMPQCALRPHHAAREGAVPCRLSSDRRIST